MNAEQIEERLRIEAEARSCFNKQEHYDAQKAILVVGQANRHEFDIFEAGKVIGGISTSPWTNKTGSTNSGGQDRIAAELLWLTLWPGAERRVMILSSQEMVDRLLKRWQGCSFPHPIEIFHYDLSKKILQLSEVMSESGVEKGHKGKRVVEIKYTAYLDDSGEPTDLGQRYSTIASVIIPERVAQEVEMEAQAVWDDFMSSTKKTEFHATETENETGIFSNLKGESLQMQKKFIQIIESFDLSAFAVTVDNSVINSAAGLQTISEGVDGKTSATNMILGLISGSLHNYPDSGSCKIIVDKGLFRGKGKTIIRQALDLMDKPVGRKAETLFRQIGVEPEEMLKDFLIDKDVKEKDSCDFTGLQLADHVARYVFKHSKNPEIGEPRYEELCRIGLVNATQNRVFQNHKMFEGILIQARLPKSLTTISQAAASVGRSVTLDDIEIVVPLFKEHLKQELTWETDCPACNSKLFWGIPSAGQKEAAEKGELILCGQNIRDKNFCPNCNTIIFTKSEIMERWSKLPNDKFGDL